MRDFYHRQRSTLDSFSRPKILGLTASPTIRSRPRDLRLIEANLDSVTKTPCIHRDELIQHVHIPELFIIPYFHDRVDPQTWCPMLKSLVWCIEDIDKRSENHMLRLLSKDEIAKLPENDITRRKWTSQGQCQLRRFSERARYIQEELGPWASDYYITESINQVTLSMHVKQNRRLDWKDEHTIHILNSLGQVRASEPTYDMQLPNCNTISKKCAAVLSFLQTKASNTFRGIVFVEQRVIVYVLSHLLSVYPGTKSLFRCGTFVGISTNENKKMELRDLLNPHDQQNTLRDFCEGRKNLLIATSALEEGIDISACNVVICFNRPPNLKSYVQRRGRARKENSKIVLLSCLNNEADVAADWEKMESEMVAEYMRGRQDSIEESNIANEADNDTRILRVDSTGALIRLDAALGHLHHFCRNLPVFPYTDNQPVFIFQEDEVTNHFCAQVTLPNSVHPSLRRAYSLRSWSTKNMARKDAAFQAYVALHKAGLLNNNLLPLLLRDTLSGMDGVEDLSSIVQIQQRYNPWHDVAKKWRTLDKGYWKRVNIRCASKNTTTMNLILPIYVPSLQWTTLHSMNGIDYEISMNDLEAGGDTEICDTQLLRTFTRMVLCCVQGLYMDCPDDSVTLFAPQRASQEIQRWAESYSEQNSSTDNGSKDRNLGSKAPCDEKLSQDRSSRKLYHTGDGAESIVTGSRHLLINGAKSIRISEANEKTEVSYLKDDFTAHGASRFLMETTKTTQLYPDIERFALLAPFVMHRLEILLVGNELLNRLLPNVTFRNLGLVTEAISASSAKELLNNRPLAFLGDTVLDFLVTSRLFANHSIWPAGYLTAKKKLIISNSHLSKMALDVGLDKFILSDPFNPKTWKPPLISDIPENDIESTRRVSKRMLAVAVEALIGAAYIDGQYENAFECSQIFLPEIRPHSVGSSVGVATLDCNQGYSTYFSQNHFAQLEELIGYKFRNNAILAEAMTHPSYEQDLAIGSYGRLAFLGNAVLNMVTVESLYHHSQPLSSNQMELLRSATVNNGFLAFICLETFVEKDYDDIQRSSLGRFTKIHRRANITLWGFLRYGNPELAADRSRLLEKHAKTCQRIRRELISNQVYPWRDLAKLGPNSDLSDIIQAMFGAVFHDSNGDMKQCALLAENFKILPTLRQLLARKVDLRHPKTKLQELAGNQDVTYKVEAEDSGNEYRCAVEVNENCITEARNGSCKEEVIIQAAELAIISLEQIYAKN